MIITRKLLFLFFFFFLSISNLFAQKVDDYWDHFYLDASLVYSGLHYENENIKTLSEPKEGWRFGTGFYFNQGKYYAWEFGVGISKNVLRIKLSMIKKERL